MLPTDIGTVTIDRVTLICCQLLTQANVSVDLFTIVTQSLVLPRDVCLCRSMLN
jgi:hypothetical protein